MTENKKPEERRTGPISPQPVWTCTDCRAVLGKLNRTRDRLGIKYQDLFVEIQLIQGMVSVPCRKCGLLNSLTAGATEIPQ